ncbi:MAG: 4a-hydroxytetrahydrobiopterin dehydratase [Rhodospirillaceae bacterium]
MEFHEQHCTPCRGGLPPLTPEEAARFGSVVPDWQINEGATRIVRSFTFPNYAKALAFVNALSAIAEAEGHHPDISFGWGYVTVSLHTHAINGLHANDFLLAAKFDRLPIE